MQALPCLSYYFVDCVTYVVTDDQRDGAVEPATAAVMPFGARVDPPAWM